MCGIAGFLNIKNADNVELIKNMTSSMSHRGPDDSGYSKVQIGPHEGMFGHRRLSILDLTPAGHQPMMRGNWTVTYNGEIYNFPEIKQCLQAAGYEFESHCDTEVLCCALNHWGIDAVKKLNGMFAFAATNGEKLYLVRDRIGIKPLYYYEKNNGIAFASELQAIEELPEFEKQINLDAYYQFMILGYIPAPLAIYNNCYKVEPGEIVVFDNLHKSSSYFWFPDFNSKGSFKGTEEEALEQLELQLIQSVKQRMISDVPLGTFLSGGIDSSMVTAIASKEFSGKLKTFSIGFDRQEYDESKYAEEIARYLGTEHTTQIMTEKEMFDVYHRIPGICGEPFFDNSIMPTHLLSCITQKHVTVALSGDGGDEHFFGYRHYDNMHKYYKLSLIPQELRVALGKLRKFFSKGKCGNALGFRNVFEAYIFSCGIFNPYYFEKLFGKSYSLENSPSFDYFCKLRENKLSKESIFPYLEQRYYMVDDILSKVDRASMRCSLEVRVPLLDHSVVEFVNTLPDNFKVQKGKRKYLLKKLLSKYVPEHLWERPKMGFSCPFSYWLKNYLNDEFNDLVLSKSSGSPLNHDFVKKLWDDFNGKGALNHMLLWNILSFEQWKTQKKAYF